MIRGRDGSVCDRKQIHLTPFFTEKENPATPQRVYYSCLTTVDIQYTYKLWIGNVPVLISECTDDRCDCVAAQIGQKSLPSLPHTQSMAKHMINQWEACPSSSFSSSLPLTCWPLVSASSLNSIFLQNRTPHLWPFNGAKALISEWKIEQLVFTLVTSRLWVISN